jgi:hypothetical protein
MHVPGKENPADLASRGVSAAELKKSKLWFEGPEWLGKPKEFWPQCRIIQREEVPEALMVDKKQGKIRKVTVVSGPKIDKAIEHLRSEEVKFDMLTDALVCIARWTRKVNTGPMKKINDKYKDERSFEKSFAEVVDENNRWIEKVRTVAQAMWIRPDRAWPGKDLSKPEVTLTVLSNCLQIDPPEMAYNIISPDERNEAGAIWLRETQKHYFPNLWEMKGLDIVKENLNGLEKKLHNQFNILFDEKLQVLLVSGRVSLPTPKVRVMTRRQQREADLLAAEAEPVEETDDPIGEPPWDFEVNPDPFPFPDGYTMDDIDGLNPVVLLPGRGMIAESVIRDAHVNSGHGGNQKILRLCRERVWVDCPSVILRKVQSRCRNCIFLRAKVIAVTEGCLPKDRTTCTRPFGIVGVDMTGPIFIFYNEKEIKEGPPAKKVRFVDQEEESSEDVVAKGPIKGRFKTSGAFRKLQVYVMIVTCCNTRLVNVQVCKNLTTLEIAKAFETFCSEEGRPERVISDNAKQFKKMKRLYQEAVRTYISPKNPRAYWKFIPSRAAWWGGFYEGLIRPFKATLHSILPRMRIDSLLGAHQVCKQAEACLNHRPLWVGLNSDTDVLAVTPFQFKSVEIDVGREAMMHNNGVELDILKKMKSKQSTAMGVLWHKVRMSHLTELQKFHERRTSAAERTLKVDDLVLLKSDWSARSFWPIARVTKVYPDAKGIVRTVDVSKYVPNEINKELADSLYGAHTLSKLTRTQLRQVTGFFKPLEIPQAVKNLVHFEMWKPFEHPERGAIIGNYGKKLRMPESYIPKFENFSTPSASETNLTYRYYSVQSEEITNSAAELVIKHGKQQDLSEQKSLKEDRITCGV